MITFFLIALALTLGYLLTVGCSLAATFGITSAAPAFVMQDHLITSGYKRVQALIWLLCTALGAFVAEVAAGVGNVNVWMVGGLLSVLLVTMLWVNTWEARQRGMAHQILMSFVTVAGVAGGAWLEAHFLGSRR